MIHFVNNIMETLEIILILLILIWVWKLDKNQKK
nr:MAG TPA: hypothetical protein [Crassvirales sp.]